MADWAEAPGCYIDDEGYVCMEDEKKLMKWLKELPKEEFLSLFSDEARKIAGFGEGV
jgi:hypothetical protein